MCAPSPVLILILMLVQSRFQWDTLVSPRGGVLLVGKKNVLIDELNTYNTLQHQPVTASLQYGVTTTRYHPSCVGSKYLEIGLEVLGNGDLLPSKVASNSGRNVLEPLSPFVDFLFYVRPQFSMGLRSGCRGVNQESQLHAQSC